MFPSGKRKTFLYILKRIRVYVPAVDPFPPCTVDSEMNFIRNMGAIFDKEETAAQVIDEIESVLRELQKKAKGKDLSEC